jgi:hypothetical protein
MYRQATVAAGWAYIQTFGADAQETDPVEMSYLVGLSGALLKEASWSTKLEATGKTAAQATAWKNWLDAGAVWPPTELLKAAPGAPAGEVAVGVFPTPGTLPHYKLPHKGESGELEASDPATLLALALYHEEAAIKADPSAKELIAMVLDPWRLPIEPISSARPKVPDDWLFLSTATSGLELAFLADLKTASDMAATQSVISSYAAKTASAAIISHCQSKTAFLDLDCVLDQGGLLAKEIEDQMQKVRGKEDSFYRVFSELARVGVYRAASLAAQSAGDQDSMGRLKLNALDRSTGIARDPLFLLSVAAWDCGNRNSMRCADLLHSLNSDIPGLEAVRFPVDALQIRIGRNAAPAGTVH